MRKVILIISLIAGLYIFNYFTGLFFKDPVDVAAISVDKLQIPPLIVVPYNDPPINVTFTSSEQGGYIALQWWYEWGPNPQHPAPDWEPIYVYWDTNQLVSAGKVTLRAIIDRIHFQWKTITSGFYINNSTQITVTFSSIFHTPTVSNKIINRIFLPRNSTFISSYSYITDPNSPYCCWYGVNDPRNNPNGYENDAVGNAAPLPPFSLYTLCYADVLCGVGSLQTGTEVAVATSGGAYFILAGIASYIEQRVPTPVIRTDRNGQPIIVIRKKRNAK